MKSDFLIFFFGTVFIALCVTKPVTSQDYDSSTTESSTDGGDQAGKLTSADQTSETSVTKDNDVTAAGAPVINRTTSRYQINGKDGLACILLQMDAQLDIRYKDKDGNPKVANVIVPPAVNTSGDCKIGDTANMRIIWRSYDLFWGFTKSGGGEGWYVEKVEFRFSPYEREFSNPPDTKKYIRVLTPEKTMLFPTPAGRSYVCQGNSSIELHGKHYAAKLEIREFQLQPFIYKNGEFGSEFACSTTGTGSYRDETAPVAVGSTLAVVVLLTVAGYGVYRYFKIKKVQYDTME